MTHKEAIHFFTQNVGKIVKYRGHEFRLTDYLEERGLYWFCGRLSNGDYIATRCLNDVSLGEFNVVYPATTNFILED